MNFSWLDWFFILAPIGSALLLAIVTFGLDLHDRRLDKKNGRTS